MMFKAITAHSFKDNFTDIADELVRESNGKLGVHRPSAGVLYASAPHDTETLKGILKGITEAFPGVEIVGGTAVGGFTDESGLAQAGYWLCLLVSDTATFITGCIPNLTSLMQANEFTAAFRTSLHENPGYHDPKGCLIYSPYSNIDGDKLIDRVQGVLPENCLIFGGMATDYWNEQDLANFSKVTPPAENSLLFFAKDGLIHLEDDTLVYLMFHGELEVQSAVSYGWSDVGMLYPACGNDSILTEIDGKRPHAFLSEFQHPLSLAEYSHTEYSLWIHAPGEEPHIRDIFFDKTTDNYYTKGASLPPRFQISFSFPDKTKVLNEYTHTLGRLADDYGLVIGNICATHLVVLEQDAHLEYSEMTKAFHQTPMICSYVFGEYGPSITSRKSKLHSCSGVLFCLKENGRSENGIGESRQAFLEEIVRNQREEIKSLQRQLKFFEGSKNSKMQKLTEDCLGVLLCRSHKSLSSIAEQLSASLKAYYKKEGVTSPYPTSRNRVIEHLGKLKKRAQKLL